MTEPVTVRTSKYRINVGSALKIKEKTGLDFFAKDEASSPLASPVNAVLAVQAIAEPPIDLSDVGGEELLQIYRGFVEESQRFFPQKAFEKMVQELTPT
jgi:hypothetical protein